MFCAVYLVERLYVKGGSKGCFAAVFSVREVAALDVSVREPHLCSCASVSFFGSCATFVFRAPIFIVQCHTILHDHPCWYFNRSTYRSILLSRSHVFTNAVHLNTIHRFAGTVRGRGGSHMVDRVASNDHRCFTR